MYRTLEAESLMMMTSVSVVLILIHLSFTIICVYFKRGKQAQLTA